MEREEITEKVQETLCQIAFAPTTGTAVGHQVRCLELLAKLTGMFDGRTGGEKPVIVEDV